MTKEQRNHHNEQCLQAYQREQGKEGEALPFGPTKAEAKEMANRIYSHFWPEITSHREWAESFNVKDDIARLIQGRKPL